MDKGFCDSDSLNSSIAEIIQSKRCYVSVLALPYKLYIFYLFSSFLVGVVVPLLITCFHSQHNINAEAMLSFINAKKKKTKTKQNYMLSNMLNDSTASDKLNKVIIVNRYELTWTHCTVSLQRFLRTDPSNKQQRNTPSLCRTILHVYALFWS